MNTEVIIVGAGVLGLSLAYHLSQRHISSLVLEREAFPGTHASGKNAGMFRHLYRHSELSSWALRSRELWPEEIRNAYFTKTGSVVVGRKSPGHHEFLFEETEILLPGDSSRELLPAVITREDGLLDSGGYLNAIYRLTDKRYASLKLNSKVLGVKREAGLWQVRTERAETYSAPVLVNAAGAWLNSFLSIDHPELALPAVPFARHLFVVHGFEAEYMPQPNCGYYWDETTAWYMRLWENNSRLVSICDQIPADPDAFTPPAETTELLAEALLRSFPEREDSLHLGKSWHCFRTYTEDSLPIWGFDKREKGLFWLAAFGGLGMSTSFAAAFDAARELAGDKVPGLEDFSPGRAALREQL